MSSSLITRAYRSPQAHERIGDCEPAALPAQTPRRLMIRTGSSPRGCTGACPQPCKRQNPRQERSAAKNRGNGPQTGSEAQKSKQHYSRLIRLSNTLDRRRSHPDENQSGRMRRHERHVGPDRQKCRAEYSAVERARRVHPPAGANLRREEPQERHRGEMREAEIAVVRSRSPEGPW